MKNLLNYINEALKINSKSRVVHTTEVNNINEFHEIINEEIKKCKEDNNPKLDLSFIRFSDEFIDSRQRSLNYLFNNYLYNLKDITVLDITGWNLEKFETINGLFSNCNYLENIIGLDTLDLSNIYSAEYLFRNCPKLDFSCVKNLNVKGIKKLEGVFMSNKITNLDFLSNWDISECEDISGMFFSCKSLTNIDGIKNWNVSSLRNNYNLPALDGINNLFMYCNALTNVDLSNWTLGKDLIWVNHVFSDCYGLKTLKIFNVTGTIRKAESLFEDCEQLESIENIEKMAMSNKGVADELATEVGKFKLE